MAGFIKQQETLTLDENGAGYRKIFRAHGFTDKFSVIQHPDFPRRLSFDPDRPSAICTDVGVDWVRGSLDAWDIEASYRDVSIQPPADSSAGDVSIDRQLQLIRIWRLGASVPADVDNPSETADIGGRGRDVGGEPIDHPISVHMVNITKKILKPLPELLWEFIKGARNNAVWRGYPKGKAYFLGVRTAGKQTDVNVDATFSFAVDELWHMRQRPLTGSSGSVITKGKDDPGQPLVPVGCAKTVTWYQPFMRTEDFAALGVG